MAFLPKTTDTNPNEFEIHTQSIPSNAWCIGSSTNKINVIVFILLEGVLVETSNFVLLETSKMWIIQFDLVSFPRGTTGYVHIFTTGHRKFAESSQPVWNIASNIGIVDLLTTIPFNAIKLTFNTNDVMMFYKRNSALHEEYEEFSSTPFSITTGALFFTESHSVAVGSCSTLSESSEHTVIKIEGANTLIGPFEETTTDILFCGLSRDADHVDRTQVIRLNTGTTVKRNGDDFYVKAPKQTLSIPLILLYN